MSAPRLSVVARAPLPDLGWQEMEKDVWDVRNIPGVVLVASARVTARDVIGATHVVATRGAIEKLQEALS